MLNMTLLAFREYVVRTFRRTDKNIEILEALNDTLRYMSVAFPFEDLKEEAFSNSIITLGDYKILLPNDFVRIMGEVRILDGKDSQTLRKITKSNFDNLYPHPNYTNVQMAKPKHYCVFNNQILFGPVPDKVSYVYEFSYTTLPVVVDDDRTPVPLSGKYPECLRTGTLARLYLLLGNDAEGVKWQNAFNDNMMLIMRLETQNTAPKVIFQEYQDL